MSLPEDFKLTLININNNQKELIVWITTVDDETTLAESVYNKVLKPYSKLND